MFNSCTDFERAMTGRNFKLSNISKHEFEIAGIIFGDKPGIYFDLRNARETINDNLWFSFRRRIEQSRYIDYRRNIPYHLDA